MKPQFIWTFIFLAVWLIEAAFTYGQTENPPPKFQDLSGGANIQRQRIDRAIETAGKLNVDEAIASLSEYNESFELAQLAGKSSASFGFLKINCMLGDRRISKIFQHLNSLPVTVADAKAQRIFEDHLAILQKEWQKLAKTGGLPGTGPPHHATSAGAFFCSFFSSKEIFDSKIKRWNALLGQPEFERLRYPTRLIEPLFHMNLLVISGHKHGKSVSQLNKELAPLCEKIWGEEKPSVQVTQMRMFQHNAETLETDFTH